MYSPKIREEFIPALYQLKQKHNRPMTHLVNEAVYHYLQNHKEESNESTTRQDHNNNRTEDRGEDHQDDRQGDQSRQNKEGEKQ